MNNYKNNKGITLIALVITIIVMLIIAAITIDASIKDEGVIDEAKNTRGKVENFIQNAEEDTNSIMDVIMGNQED